MRSFLKCFVKKHALAKELTLVKRVFCIAISKFSMSTHFFLFILFSYRSICIINDGISKRRTRNVASLQSTRAVLHQFHVRDFSFLRLLLLTKGIVCKKNTKPPCQKSKFRRRDTDSLFPKPRYKIGAACAIPDFNSHSYSSETYKKICGQNKCLFLGLFHFAVVNFKFYAKHL